MSEECSGCGKCSSGEKIEFAVIELPGAPVPCCQMPACGGWVMFQRGVMVRCKSCGAACTRCRLDNAM